MKFVIGGAYQGKLAYVQKMCGIGITTDILDGEQCELHLPEKVRVFNRLHAYIRRMLLDGIKREQELLDIHNQIYKNLQKVMRDNPDVIFVSDEIGYGIVPMEAFDRLYREETGRICCKLAEQASSVTRVVCGIGTVIEECR